MIQLILFVFLFTLSLYILYILVKYDFVLARKSILLQEIFDITFSAFIIFFLTGRLFYILGELQFNLFNPLQFFHVFRFPGILFIGGLLGFLSVIYAVFRKRKILFRLLDIYSLSLFPLFMYVLFTSYNNGYFFYFNILVFCLSCFFFIFGLYSYKNYTLQDGSIAILFLCLACVFTIISEFGSHNGIIFLFFTIPQLVSVVLFIVLAGFLLTHEGFIKKKK